MPKLFVVRHAEPVMRGVMLGRTDSPLSEAGKLQARTHMKELRPAVVYSSPLRRALQTAGYIEAPLVVLEDLAEVSYGDWEGKTWAQIETEWPDLVRRKRDDWFAVTPPGGESWEQVTVRARRVLERVRQGAFPAAVVAHFGFNAELMRQAAGTDPAHFSQAYCEFFSVDL